MRTTAKREQTIRQSHNQRRPAGVAVLDVLTAVVLLVAAYFLVRPGSELRRSVSQWSARRTAAAAIRSHWEDAVALALPLYETGGSPDVIEFLDYECPFCRSAAATVDSAIDAGVKVAVVHLPLRIHRLAKPAAIAALCAARSGDFVRMHRTLIHGDSWQEQTTATGIVADAGADSALSDCATTGGVNDVLSEHIALAEILGVTATPRFVSRGGPLYGPPTLTAIRELAGKQ